MKETYAPVILRKKALLTKSKDKIKTTSLQPRGTSMQQALLRSMYRPFLLLLCEPICLCLCIYTALLIGTLYLFFGAFPLVFSNTYGFNLWQVGLTFLGQLTGTFIGLFLDPLFKWNLQRLIRQHASDGKEFLPEFRLPPAIVGAPLSTIGLFWFAWSSTASVRTYSKYANTLYQLLDLLTRRVQVHWIMPVIGSSFFGLG